ncbi:hypothetical protein AMP9_2253 [plant metagenome]|uniref:Uncharacterized protein n=1 Tax=plant metagenome TaxID=1297885 RepID=A0A484NSI9_9ZZZZ
MRRAARGLREGGAWRHGDTSSSSVRPSYPYILCFSVLRSRHLRSRKSAGRMTGACREAERSPGRNYLKVGTSCPLVARRPRRFGAKSPGTDPLWRATASKRRYEALRSDMARLLRMVSILGNPRSDSVCPDSQNTRHVRVPQDW